MEWVTLVLTELKAFICLLLIAGVHRAHIEAIREIWSPENGRPIFCAHNVIESLQGYSSLYPI